MSLSSCVVSPVVPAVPYPSISYRILLPVPLVARRPVEASRGIRRAVASRHSIAFRIGFLIAERGVSMSIPITAPPLRYRPL